MKWNGTDGIEQREVLITAGQLIVTGRRSFNQQKSAFRCRVLVEQGVNVKVKSVSSYYLFVSKS